jgi:hypothetical protein
VAAVDLVLLAVVMTFVGRTLRQAVGAYGGAPAELESGTGSDAAARHGDATAGGQPPHLLASTTLAYTATGRATSSAGS